MAILSLNSEILTPAARVLWILFGITYNTLVRSKSESIHGPVLRRPDSAPTYYEKDTDEDSDGELLTTQQTYEDRDDVVPCDKDDVEQQHITRRVKRRSSRTIPEPITTSDTETDDDSEVEMGKKTALYKKTGAVQKKRTILSNMCIIIETLANL